MRSHLFIILSSLLSWHLAQDVSSSTSLIQPLINEQVILRRQERTSKENTPGNPSNQETSNRGQETNNRTGRIRENSNANNRDQETNNVTGREKNKGTSREKNNGDGRERGAKEGDNQDEGFELDEEEQKNDDPRGETRKDVTIILKEPIQGQLRVLNIPLGGQQKIRWEIPAGETDSNCVSVTAVLPGSSGYPIIFPIAENYSLGETEVLWNTSIASTNRTEQPLRPSSQWSLYIHDCALKYDGYKYNRLISTSVKFNLYIPPDVSNRFKAAAFLSSSPSFCGLTALFLVIFSLF